MSLTPFYNEEQVQTAEGEVLTLVLDFRAIDVAEGICDRRPMPEIVAELRGGRSRLGVAGKVLWACLRERHNDITLNQAAGLIFDPANGGKVGFALDALLDRAFPLNGEAEDEDKPANPRQRRRGRSKPSSSSGSD